MNDTTINICPLCSKLQPKINRDHPLSKGLVDMKTSDEPLNRYRTCDWASIFIESLKKRGWIKEC